MEFFSILQVEDRTPFVTVALQECERMNLLCEELRRSLQELELGLTVMTNFNIFLHFLLYIHIHVVHNYHDFSSISNNLTRKKNCLHESQFSISYNMLYIYNVLYLKYLKYVSFDKIQNHFSFLRNLLLLNVVMLFLLLNVVIDIKMNSICYNTTILRFNFEMRN